MSWTIVLGGHAVDKHAESHLLGTARKLAAELGVTHAEARTSFHGDVNLLAPEASDEQPAADTAAEGVAEGSAG